MQYLQALAWLTGQQSTKVKPKSASGVKKLAQKVNQQKPKLKSLKHQEKADVSTNVVMGFPNGAMSAAFRVAFNEFGRGGFSDLVAERAQNPGREGAPTDTEIGVQLLTEVQETVVNLATDVGVGFVDGATPDFIFDPRDYYDPYYEPAYAAGEALGFTFATGGFSGGGAGRAAYRYASRVRMRGLQDPVSHNFPFSFDSFILNTQAIPQKHGYNIYRLPGFLGNKPGNFEIGVTRNNVIDHRFFRRSSNKGN